MSLAGRYGWAMSQSSESLTEARVNVPMTARMYEQLRHASFAQRRSMAGILRDAFELQEDVAELLRLCDFTMERAAVAMATTTDSKWHDYVNRDMRRIEEMRSLVAEMLTRLPARLPVSRIGLRLASLFVGGLVTESSLQRTIPPRRDRAASGGQLSPASSTR